jgi:exo-1,4-beta-D-glucosaminidase
MSVKFSREMKMDAEPDSSTRVFKLPEIEGLSDTWFLSLKLEDPSDDMVSENFYWFSTTPETLEWDKYTTPTRTFANYTALEGLPPVTLKVTWKSADGYTTVSVSNPTKSLAFAVHLKVKNDLDGNEILPVLWEDNYFSLPPGESREITATYATIAKGRALVEVEGWNVK